MKTTLVYAGIAGYGFNCLSRGMDAGWISHGLAHLSSAVKYAGHQVDLIDLRALTGWEDFAGELKRRQPDVLGLTMMSVDFNPVREAARIAKEIFPQMPIVVGGAHPSIATQEVAAVPHYDYIVVGEGEITYPWLLSAIETGQRPAGRVLMGEAPDLDTLPYPDRQLFLHEWRRYGYTLESPEVPFVPELPAPFLTIIAGRGCIYNCSFCMPGERAIFGKKVRSRSVESIIGELKLLREQYHFRSFMFHDDCLTEDRAWIPEFCRRYKEEGFTAVWACQSRADIIVHHEDMVALMADAGLRLYFTGYESGNDRVLRFLRKGTTRAKNLQAARICEKYGIAKWANYMLGIPTETEAEMKDTISLMKAIDPDYYSPAFYTPHPGTDLYDYVVQHDLSTMTSHDQYRRNPTETKIKGQDIRFLTWAAKESQKRTLANRWRRFRKKLPSLIGKYTSPRRYWRRLSRMAGVLTTRK